MEKQTKDPLTGLNDRSTFFYLLKHHVAVTNEYKAKMALLCVDLNRFYRVNQIYGYPVGDAILNKFADLIRSVTREQDHVARIGDNRFALILTGIMNTGHAELAAQKILRLIQVPFKVGNNKVNLDCTIGISVCPLHASKEDMLLKECEQALFDARATNHAVGISFISAPEDEISEYWDIEFGLDNALDRQEFLVYYQPKISLDSGGPVGAEALIRWQHPSRGFIPPNDFIHIAERTGHIKPITNWVLNTVLRQSSQWTDKWGPLTASVNIPPNLLLHQDLKDFVSNALKLWGCENIGLVLEIVERSLIKDPQRSFSVLKELQAMGVRISIDDFGTGYSTLSYFKVIPIDELKVDQSFVSDLLSSKQDQNIVRLIIDLAHSFEFEVVAEGVENIETLRMIKEFGCDEAQGFYIAKPMPQDEFKQWLLTFEKTRS